MGEYTASVLMGGMSRLLKSLVIQQWGKGRLTDEGSVQSEPWMGKRIFILILFYNEPFWRNCGTERQMEGRTDRQTDKQRGRRTDVWLLCMWMKERQDFGQLRGSGKLWEELPKHINHEDLCYSFLVKEYECSSNAFLYLERKKVYLPAFGAMGARQYIFSLCRPICILFNDAVLAVTIIYFFLNS
jgi:hypothetical protein